MEDDELPKFLLALKKEKPVWRVLFSLYLLLDGRSFTLPLPMPALALLGELTPMGKFVFSLDALNHSSVKVTQQYSVIKYDKLKSALEDNASSLFSSSS